LNFWYNRYNTMSNAHESADENLVKHWVFHLVQDGIGPLR